MKAFVITIWILWFLRTWKNRMLNPSVRVGLSSKKMKPKFLFLKNFCLANFCCWLVTKSCLTLYNPVDCSMPGFLVLLYLPEFGQAHVHWVVMGMPSNHLSLCCSLLLLPPNQGLFQWVGFLHQAAKVLGVTASALVLPMNIQDWFPLGWTGLISLLSKELLRVVASLKVRKCSFFGGQPSLWSNVQHPYMTSEKNHSFDYLDLCRQSDVSAF